MGDEPKSGTAPSRHGTRRAGLAFSLVCLLWLAVAFWNSVKPMPPGTHVTSLPARLAESQVDFIDDPSRPGLISNRMVALVDHADQMIVLDLCPLPRELAEHLLLRRRQRPNLKIVLVTDPRGEAYGGTPVPALDSLEQAGVIAARIRLERLRDSNPLYSSLWRLTLGWWDDPFADAAGEVSWTASLRRLNLKADQRRLLVADDGAGGWSSILAATADTGVEIRGHLARDMAASELQIATWSTDDDRLPAPPPTANRSMGTIDARFLTEGAILGALRDVIGVTGDGDSVRIVIDELGNRSVVTALRRAAARGAQVQLLLDPERPVNQAVAAELSSDRAGIDVRWQTAAAARFVLIRHRNDVWLNIGSANLVRRDIDDLNLEANLELHMPARAAPARAAADAFARQWSGAAAYAEHAGAADTYWRYRFAEATGLPMF
jgi:hypothetical protein